MTSLETPAGNPPLDRYRVVDLSSGIAGGYCTKLLADGGAEVVKLESPAGDPLRRWSASGAAIPPGDDGALFQFLACSKHSVVVDPNGDLDLAFRLVESADAVVWSPGSLAQVDGLWPSDLTRRLPGATVAAITPFGLEGPWSGRPATEFTLQAWSGGPGQRGAPDRPPLAAGGRLGEWAAGTFAAIALLASRHRTLQTGAGELLDVSVLESLVMTHTMHPVTFFTIAGFPFRGVRSVNLPGIHQASDGYVGFMVVTGQQWLDFCALVEQPSWLDDESLVRFAVRNARRPELLATIDRWVGERTVNEVVELASLFRIPVAAVGNGATIPEFDHFVGRDFYIRNPRGGFLQPDVPYTLSGGATRVSPRPAPRLGEHTVLHAEEVRAPAPPPVKPALHPGGLPFEGLRVADFTAFWAGPIVGNILGMLGADVIHVESPVRPDSMRFNTIRSMDEDQWWEWSPLFHGPNTDKRGLTLDLSKDAGRDLALRLIEHCDIVLDNYSPRVMEEWGLGYDDIRAVRPDVIMVRMPAFGLSGPWRDRVGYAQTMEQISGLAWLAGYPDGAPEIPNGPCDPIAGSHATIALLLALEHRRRTGAGMLVEVAMVGGALNVAAEQVIEYSAYGHLLERLGNRDPQAAPQGLYRTADVLDDGRQDRWVAITIETDEQWQGLRQTLGNPEWSRNPDLDPVAGRRTAHDQIDRELAAWCVDRTADEVVQQLWTAGIPVGKVVYSQEQADVLQLQARGFFEELEHPVTGCNLHSTYPVRFSSGPSAFHQRPAPTLGQHSREVLAGLLGFSDREVDGLEADGVIGQRPGGGKAF